MNIVATPWRRYGKNRTYLAHEDGTALGWIDNLTGEVHTESDVAGAHIAAWVAGEAVAATETDFAETFAVETEADEPELSESAQPLEPEPGPDVVKPLVESEIDAAAEPEPAQDWEDLALRRPGQAVREQAKAELSNMWQESKFKTVLRVAFDTHTDERAWRMGAAGEEAIGTRLEKLAEHGWRVLHSVPVGENGSDIDHLVIGPGGVWTINAKNHRGKKIWVAPRQIRVDGHTVPYIRNSEFEANRVRKILTKHLGWEPYVRPALVFMTGTLVPEVTIKGKPEHVDILDRMDVARRLKREPVRMSADQVDEVFEIARRSTTWVR